MLTAIETTAREGIEMVKAITMALLETKHHIRDPHRGAGRHDTGRAPLMTTARTGLPRLISIEGWASLGITPTSSYLSIMPRSPHPLMAALVVAFLAACQGSDSRPDDGGFSAQDSIATATEVSASLEGGTAPGKQSYLYRGLYAGMTRPALEGKIGPAAADSAGRCQPSTSREGGTTCTYDTVLGTDSARVAISATYVSDARGGSPVAREITIVRELPIAVDGVLVVKELGDAFAAQTALLDRRESTYGHHSATVRMGTINGQRQNYATVVVAEKHGREELTVTLTRAAALAPAPSAAPPKKKGK